MQDIKCKYSLGNSAVQTAVCTTQLHRLIAVQASEFVILTRWLGEWWRSV